MVLRYKLLIQSILFVIVSNIGFSDVTVTIGDVSVDGYTEDIIVPVTLSNPNQSVGGFQFDVMAMPNIIDLSGVSPENGNNFLRLTLNRFDRGNCPSDRKKMGN